MPELPTTKADAKVGYRPADPIDSPPLYAWPPKPLATVRWLAGSLLWPWGLVFIGLAVVAWRFLTPDLATMAKPAPGWIALIWLRNAALLTLLAGTLHWWLHIRRSQDREYKFDPRWLARDNPRFLFRDQVKDNMFWSLVSGVSFWTAYEALTLWAYASGTVASVSWADAPVYLGLMCIVVFFWSTLHFYFVHRALHWPPLFRLAHALHHRNVNTGPWSGISMHPLEHSVYFTLFALWWIVPVDPIVIVLTGFYQGLSPAISHSGFDQLKFGRARVSIGDHFHGTHHRLFEVNYGNTTTPFDRLFGSWHDGTALADEALRERRKQRLPGAV